MEWHRKLTVEDVDTAHLLLDQHQPLQEYLGTTMRVVCASALHPYTAPIHPCERRSWAEQVLAAEERGEVEGPRSNVARIA